MVFDCFYVIKILTNSYVSFENSINLVNVNESVRLTHLNDSLNENSRNNIAKRRRKTFFTQLKDHLQQRVHKG